MAGRLAGRVALVTGASRGLGRAVALLFAREGAHVVAVGRTQGALEELDDEIKATGGQATLCPLDLLKPDAIDGMAVAIAERWGKLDILVGNAGTLGRLTPVGHLPPKEWDQGFALNVTANYRLIRAFDPLLRRSDAGRAIFVTSGAARKGAPFWGLYASTKAALDALVRAWAAEIEKTPMRVNLLSPGPTRTAMRALAFPGEDPATLKSPAEIAEIFLPLAETACTRHGEIIEAQPPR